LGSQYTLSSSILRSWSIAVNFCRNFGEKDLSLNRSLKPENTNSDGMDTKTVRMRVKYRRVVLEHLTLFNSRNRRSAHACV
jgi:hypothetical protein